jgi:hypothetical protein
MLLVRIVLSQGKSPEHRRQVRYMVYRAARETVYMPEHDSFQVIIDSPDAGRADS